MHWTNCNWEEVKSQITALYKEQQVNTNHRLYRVSSSWQYSVYSCMYLKYDQLFDEHNTNIYSHSINMQILYRRYNTISVRDFLEFLLFCLYKKNSLACIHRYIAINWTYTHWMALTQSLITLLLSLEW